MRHHEGLKLGEIAAALGLAEGTVKRQLHAAVHRLRARAPGGERHGRRPGMTACASRRAGVVELYFYDELPTAGAAEVARHLASCAECRTALDELHLIGVAAGRAATRRARRRPATGPPLMARIDRAVAVEPARAGIP